MDLDLGNLISLQISQIVQSSTSRLGFPALITALCDIQRVISDTLIFESLSPVINLAYIRKNCWNPTYPSITFPGGTINIQNKMPPSVHKVASMAS